MSKLYQPLKDKSVLITRPQENAGLFADKLKALGAKPIIFPTIRITEPSDEEIRQVELTLKSIADFDRIIFTSGNAVYFFFKYFHALGLEVSRLKKIKILAVGPTTAKKIQNHRVKVDFIPTAYTADSVIREIGNVKNERILLPRADIAAKKLPEQLSKQGAIVTDLVVYKTKSNHPGEKALENLLSVQPDFITFTSASTVKGFAEVIKNTNFEVSKSILCCIGPITAEAAKKLNYKVDVICETYTLSGLIKAINQKLKQS